jgi:hypothetical protein
MTINHTKIHLSIATFFTVLGLAGCGGTSDFDATDNTIGGTITGLWPGAEVRLNNNGADDLLLSDNGNFTFKTSVKMGGAYAVTVEGQPTGGTCTVENGSGTATAQIADVSVSCEQLSAPIDNSEDLTVLNGRLIGLPEGVNVTMSTFVVEFDTPEKEITGTTAQSLDYLTSLTEAEIGKNYNLFVRTNGFSSDYLWRCGVLGLSLSSTLTVVEGANTNDLTCMQEIMISVSNKFVKIGTNGQEPVDNPDRSAQPAFGDTLLAGSSSGSSGFGNTYRSFVKAGESLVIQPQTGTINCSADTISPFTAITPTGDATNGWTFSGFDPKKLYKINCN